MSASISYFHLISIIVSFLSVSMGFFLIFIKSRKKSANIYLGLLLLTYSLFFLPGLLESMGFLDDLPHIVRLNFFAGALVGPLTYLYCKSSIHKQRLSLSKNIFHLSPFIIAFIAFWPTLIKSGPEKIAIYHNTITEGKVPEPVLSIVFLILISLVYTVFSMNMVRKYLVHIKNIQSNIDSSFHKWLLFLCFSLLLPIIAVLLITVLGTISVLASVLTLASFVVIIYVTLTLKPKFFDDLPNQIPDSSDSIEEKTKYQSSSLQEAQKSKYQSKIIDHMSIGKPFLDQEITINQFAEQVDIPSHHVSQIINERLGINFLDFINKYRIEEAKANLLNRNLSHYTIVTIASDSGFKSKTAFYSAFKKHVGSTPSQFRKENQGTQNGK